jgi:hypothetical protein
MSAAQRLRPTKDLKLKRGKIFSKDLVTMKKTGYETSKMGELIFPDSLILDIQVFRKFVQIQGGK